MNQTLLRLLWMFVFFVVGFVALGFFISHVLQWQFHDSDRIFFGKLVVGAIVGLSCLIGLPSIALILCVRGVLPGTRRD